MALPWGPLVTVIRSSSGKKKCCRAPLAASAPTPANASPAALANLSRSRGRKVMKKPGHFGIRKKLVVPLGLRWGGKGICSLPCCGRWAHSPCSAGFHQFPSYQGHFPLAGDAHPFSSASRKPSQEADVCGTGDCQFPPPVFKVQPEAATEAGWQLFPPPSRGAQRVSTATSSFDRWGFQACRRGAGGQAGRRLSKEARGHRSTSWAFFGLIITSALAN